MDVLHSLTPALRNPASTAGHYLTNLEAVGVGPIAAIRDAFRRNGRQLVEFKPTIGGVTYAAAFTTWLGTVLNGTEYALRADAPDALSFFEIDQLARSSISSQKLP